MLIHSIRVKNILSFGPESEMIELKPLNVIIGPNGSGKSNLIDVVSLLQSMPRELAFPSGGIHDWLWKGAENTPTASIDTVLDNPGHSHLRHVFSFTETAQRFELVDEKIENHEAYHGEQRPYFYYKFENGLPVICSKDQRERRLQRESVDVAQSILSQRKDPDHYPEITYIGDALSKIRIYREWSFGRQTPPRLPQKSDLPNVLLDETCDNLGLVLNWLKRDANTKQTILKNLKVLYNGIDDYDIQVQGGTVQVFLYEGKFVIPATRLSDGTLRYLCLLAILCHPSPPPLICIEEPELGLHPDVLSTLAELLNDASHRTQIIITTHSDALVDNFTDAPNAVMVCEKHDGSTTMKRLSKEALSVWLKKYTLGELWRTGEIGGVRY